MSGLEATLRKWGHDGCMQAADELKALAADERLILLVRIWPVMSEDARHQIGIMLEAFEARSTARKAAWPTLYVN